MSLKLFAILLSLTLTLSCLGQKVDRAPSRRQNYVAAEGGSWEVKIDSTTSLDTLIARLSKKWELKETGKAYWIGYTDDMFSIAAHGDKAIYALVKLLNSSASHYTNYGAIYSLHLIGINRTVVGRFSEKFIDPKARMALLEFLKDSSLQEDIMRLLIRDPWSSDVPYIIEALKSCKTDSWALVSGMTRYSIEHLPIHPAIPDSISDITVRIKDANKYILEHDFDFDRQIKEVLDSFRYLNNSNISIEDDLLKLKLTGDYTSKFGTPVSIGGFFGLLDMDPYASLGSRVQYYIKDGHLYICSSATAREILIDWWENLSAEEKSRFYKE